MKKTLLALAALALGLGLLAVLRIGPRNLFGMLRYDQRREGDRRLGETAPDVELVSLDGSPARLSGRLGGRPLVLVFGSYT